MGLLSVRKYKGFWVHQRNETTIPFIVLVADAREVAMWSQADDIRIDRGNVQRQLVESRWRQVKKFFNASPESNVIPTSVTIAFDSTLERAVAETDLSETKAAYYLSDPDAEGMVSVSFPDAVKDSSFIIDGQHRLKGMSEVGSKLIVPVCLFPSLTKLERAFQFVTINNKSHKVPTNNLKALITNFSGIEENLRMRLSQASITAPRFATHVDVMNEDDESPFYRLVDWVNNRHADAKPIIAPAAIENGLKAITDAFPETKNDPADAIVVMSAIWRAIHEAYGITRENIEDYPNLTLKAVIQKLTEMVVEHLRASLDPAFSTGPITAGNASQASDAARKLIALVPAEFWQDSWKLKGLDTSAGREIIGQSFRKLKNEISKNSADDYNWRAGNPLYEDSANASMES